MTNELPDGLHRPVQECQATLFPTTLKELLKEIGLSRRELNGWKRRRWTTSSDPKAKVDRPEWFELTFLPDITRCGLRPDQINLLLQTLKKPYTYDPRATLRSFTYGWVQLTPVPDAADMIEEHLDEWLADLAGNGQTSRLAEIAQTVTKWITKALEKSQE